MIINKDKLKQKPFLDELTPELKDYAYNVFPSLNDIVPKRQEMQLQPEIAPPEQPEDFQPEMTEQEPQEMEQVEPEQQMEPELPEVQELRQPASQIDPMVEKATKDRDRAILWKEMAKTRDAVIGAGLGKKFEADNTIYDTMASEAERPIKDVTLSRELKLAKDKDDANSELSKMTRESLQNLGMDMSKFGNVSYSQLEKLYPSLTQALYTKIAAEARKREAQLAREIKADNKQKDNYFKVQSSIDRQVGQLQKSNSYTGFNQAKQAKQQLDEASMISDPLKKIQRQAAFMAYAKSAQGDDSVVRSEDMKVLAGSMGFNSPTELLSKMGSKAEGAAFSPGELKQMSKVMDTIINIKRSQLQSQLSPILNRAQANEYDITESLDPTFVDSVMKAPETPESQLKKLEERLNANQSRIDQLRSKQGQ